MMSKEDVLFELGCEELPSKMVLPLAQGLATGIQAALQAAQIQYGEVIYYGTPRRLAVWIKSVDEMQAPQHLTRKGPAKQAAFDAQGKPTQALLGFARACEVSLDQIVFQSTDKGEWAVVEKTMPGTQTLQLLPGFFSTVLTQLPIPKPMYWGTQTGPFVRPVHWIVGLFGTEVIQGAYFDLKADRYTTGHRYHFPQQYTLQHPSEYESLMRRLNVEPHFETRRAMVIDQVNAIASTQQGQAVMNPDLIDEVTSIVEWPVAVMGTFSEHFLKLPEEVLIASMQAHQKCFAVRDAQHKLLPCFIAVANIESKQPEQVVAGNEKVMRARLSDADFFYSQDSKQPLIEFAPMLSHALFQAKLGSLADQLQRITHLVPLFKRHLNLDASQVNRAIALSKCDLMTGMVGEFPELQGVMGYYYAKQDDEDEAVALAIKEQYLPRFAADELPHSSVGWILSLLNRLDTLVGIFGIGQKPTGMKDPYKLRRHALAVIRLLAQYDLPVTLSSCLEAAYAAYPEKTLNQTSLSELKTFILERLPAYFQAQGIAADYVACVVAVESERIYDITKRVHALYQTRERIAPLLGGVKRVHHLLKTVQDEDINAEVNLALFEKESEQALFDALNQVEGQLKTLQTQRDYAQSLLKLSELRPVIDAYFDTVMVMVDDRSQKTNRLKLLYRLKQALLSVADLSLLGG